MKNHKTYVFTLLGAACMAVPTAKGAVLFFDNFNTANNANFDTASTSGRISGSEIANTYLRQWGQVMAIDNNQVSIAAGGGDRGLRWETASNDPTSGQFDRFNWAAGTAGSAILAAGGFVVTFDYIPANNTGTEWISFQVGTINADSGNLTNDDYGILFRNNGGIERFAASPAISPAAGGPFVPSAGGVSRQVQITYTFSSFADGSSVNAVSTLDGTQVANDNFTWNANAGEMRMELGVNQGLRIDNLMIATIPEPSAALLGSVACLGLIRRRR